MSMPDWSTTFSSSIIFNLKLQQVGAEVQKMASHFRGKDNKVTENTSSNALT